MQAGYGCFLQTYIVGIFKSADIKNWWHEKTALQDLFRPFFRIGIAFLGEKLCRFFKPQNAWNTLYLKLDSIRKLHNRVNENKARYTATPVACGWAGAVIEVTRSFGQEQWSQKSQKPKKSKVWRTDRRTDGRTKRSVESRSTRLKID